MSCWEDYLSFYRWVLLLLPHKGFAETLSSFWVDLKAAYDQFRQSQGGREALAPALPESLTATFPVGWLASFPQLFELLRDPLQQKTPGHARMESQELNRHDPFNASLNMHPQCITLLKRCESHARQSYLKSSGCRLFAEIGSCWKARLCLASSFLSPFFWLTKMELTGIEIATLSLTMLNLDRFCFSKCAGPGGVASEGPSPQLRPIWSADRK